MPKMSFDPQLAKQGGGGFEKGHARVKAAKIQNIKTDSQPNRVCLVLVCTPLDTNYQPLREAEDFDLRFAYGQESLKYYRPGVATGPADENPKVLTDIPDAEGNTVVPVDNNGNPSATFEPFNKSTAAMVFLESLRKHGFPAEVLNRGYTPDFVGMEFEFATFSPKECNEKFGTRLSTKPMQDKKDPTKTVDITYKVAVKWNNPNYLSGNIASVTATTSAPATTVSTTSESAEELAAKVLKVVIDKKKGSEIKSAQAVNGFVTNAYTQHNPKLPANKLSEVQALVKDPASLAKILVEVGLPVEFDDDGNAKPVTYPLAIPA